MIQSFLGDYIVIVSETLVGHQTRPRKFGYILSALYRVRH
nr:MAG TPA: hypothetical protein [Caudoviricetes sp.]